MGEVVDIAALLDEREMWWWRAMGECGRWFVAFPRRYRNGPWYEAGARVKLHA